MVLLQERSIDYNFIFSGQHQDTIADLRENFGVKEPDVILHKGKDINSIPKMLYWLVKVILVSLFNGRKIWQKDRKGIVLNHGDTFSTLLGSLLAKIYGHKNAHVESGLRSHNIFHPFPEELTRLAVFTLTDIYFAPGDWALKNLERYKGLKVNTQCNTLYDALQSISNKPPPMSLAIPSEPFAVVTLHRFENLYDRKKLEESIQILTDISETMKLLFILHSPTKRKLEATGLMEKLATNKNIELRPRYDYMNFIALIKKSEYVISDGGSNQEECYYLGKPCMLFRNATERKEGLGENCILSKFKKNEILNFTSNHKSFVRPSISLEIPPSEIILEKTIKLSNRVT